MLKLKELFDYSIKFIRGVILTTGFAFLSIASLHANPVLNNVAAGSATVNQTQTTTTVNQTSQKAILNWDSFNIGNNESTHFQQPAGGVALNRINAQQGASQIYGSLTATGKIILVNPAGIYFGPSAYVNVGGIIASTANITDQNFLNGNYRFDKVQGFNGSVINKGTIIAAEHGLVALIGNAVSNEGYIEAQLGTVALASGNAFTVSFTDDGLVNFQIDEALVEPGVDENGEQPSSAISNTGTIHADGGRIIISADLAEGVLDKAIFLDGTLQTRTIQENHGDIIISSDPYVSYVDISGAIDASGYLPGNLGGNVTITGHQILLESDASINVSGDAGGGNILIGGNYQGKGPLPTSDAVVMLPGATLLTNAITEGNGGNIIIWSDRYTKVAGSISATGGSESGNGGLIETSSKNLLDVNGISIDTRAPQGITGSWLLDPTNIYIADNQANATTAGMVGTNTSANTGSGGDPNVFAASGAVDDSLLTTAVLEAALASTNVTVSTTNASGTGTGIITVVDPIDWSATTTLLLSAADNIVINAAITALNGTLQLSAGSSSFISTGSSGTINVKNFTLQQGNWTQTTVSPPSFNVSNDFSITGGSFTRALLQEGTYFVSDIFGLQGIATSAGNLSGLWELASNIDATVTQYWNSGAGFSPIGVSSSNKFNGDFNGASFTINNLSINRPTTQYQGLFGYTTSAATIYDLGITNATMSVGQESGILGGYVDATINNVYSTGTISGYGNSIYGIGGLIGHLGSAGNITDSYSNVDVLGATADSVTSIGGFVGYSDGSITSSYAVGSVTGTGASSYVGGLVGTNNNTIDSSFATGNVSVGDFAYAVGGFVGQNYSTISNLFSTGNVTVGNDADSIGGFIGYSDGAITSAGSTGNITTGTNAANIGGFIGYNANNITDAYSTGDITTDTGATKVGGFVGYQSFLTITRTYASGNVSVGASSTNVGGFAGRNDTTISNSFWDTGTTGQVTGVATNNGTVTNLTAGTFDGSSGATLSASSTYSSAPYNFNIGTNLGSNTWVIFNGYTRPLLASEFNTNIVSPHQLQLAGLNSTTLSYDYTLITNIDLSRTAAGSHDIWGNAGFYPIGTTSSKFTGTFDAGSYTIDNLSMNLTSNLSSDIGLFGAINTGSSISNVSVTNADISILTSQGSSRGFGILVGRSDGDISNVYTSGSIESSSFSSWLGGIIGIQGAANSSSSLTNAYSDATVIYSGDGSSGFGSLGGLVGVVLGLVSNSYFNGTVHEALTTTNSDISFGGVTGGLIGPTGVISNSYSAGSIISDNDVGFFGGLVGLVEGNGSTVEYSYSYGPLFGITNAQGLFGIVANSSMTLTGNYWDIYTSGTTSGYDGGITGGVSGTQLTAGCFAGTGSCGTATITKASNAGVGVSIPNMANEATFTGAGWDTTNVWGIIENYSYPYLLAFYPTTPTAIRGTNNTSSQTLTLAANGNVYDTSPTYANSSFYFLEGNNVISGIDHTLSNGDAIIIYVAGSAIGNIIANVVDGSELSDLALDINSVNLQIADGVNPASVISTAVGSLKSGDVGILASASGNDITIDNDITFFLTSTGDAVPLSGDITTSGAGAMNLNADITLLDNVTLTSASRISMNNPINGAFDLTLDGGSSAQIQFKNIIGNLAPLTGLDVTGEEIDIYTNSIIVDGSNLNFHAFVALYEDSTIINSGNINFDDAVDGDSVTLKDLTINSTDGDVTFSGIIGGEPLNSLTVTGATINLPSEVHTESDQTYHASTSVFLGSDTTLETVSGIISIPDDDGVVDGNGTSSLTISNSGASNSSIASAIQGLTGFTKDGTGTLNLSGISTYSSSTTINAGTLQLGAAGAIPDASDLTIAGTFDLNDFNETVGSISGSGNITLGTGTLTTSSSNNTTFSGVISEAGNVVKAGIGTLTLSGANTYSGATNLNAGTIVANNNAALGTSSFTGSSSTTLQINDGITLANSLSLQGTGTSSQGALVTSGTGTSSGNVTLAGATTIGTLSAGNLLTMNGTINGAYALTLAGSGSVRFNGIVGGTSAPSSLTSNTSTTLAANVTTSGNQTFNNALALAASIALNMSGNSDSSITIGNGISGAFNAALSGTGTANYTFNLNGNIGSNVTVSAPVSSSSTLARTSSNDTTWNITGSNAGNATASGITGSLAFSNIKNLTAPSNANNTFVFSNGASLGGLIDASNFSKTNILDFNAYTSAVNITITDFLTGAGSAIANSSTIATFTKINDIRKSSGLTSASITLPTGKAAQITISAAGAGYLNDPIYFTNFYTLVSGGGTNAVSFNVPATYNTATGAWTVNGTTMYFSGFSQSAFTGYSTYTPPTTSASSVASIIQQPTITNSTTTTTTDPTSPTITNTSDSSTSSSDSNSDSSSDDGSSNDSSTSNVANTTTISTVTVDTGTKPSSSATPEDAGVKKISLGGMCGA